MNPIHIADYVYHGNFWLNLFDLLLYPINQTCVQEEVVPTSPCKRKSMHNCLTLYKAHGDDSHGNQHCKRTIDRYELTMHSIQEFLTSKLTPCSSSPSIQGQEIRRAPWKIISTVSLNSFQDSHYHP